MTKVITALFMLGAFPLLLFSQTAQQLEQGIQMYNTLKDTSETPGISTSFLVKIADGSEKLLKKVVQNGTAEEVRAAKYFLAVGALSRGEIYYKGTKAEQELVLPTFRSVESEFDRLGPTEFPIRYTYFGKNFKIDYADFEYSRMKFYAEMSEMLVGKDIPNMKKYAQKALDVNAKNTEYLQYVIYYFLNNEAVNDAEKTTCAQQFISLYSRMDTSERRLLNEQNTGGTYLKRNAAILLLPSNTSWDKTGELSAVKARELAATGGLDSLACRFFEQSVNKGASFNDAEKVTILDLYAKTGFKSAGLQLCNKMLTAQSSTDCEGFDLLAKYYAKFGDTQKAKSMSQSAEKCRSDKQDQADAEQRRRNKEARKANRSHGYLGAYVLRLAQRPQYIDWGGTLDIPFGRTLLEFSYLKAVNDQDYLLMERLSNKDGVADLDNPHWDGFYAHVGFKKSERTYDKSKSYGGMLFTYNQRNFQPQTTFVTPKSSPFPSQQEVNFEPKMTTYGLVFNFGSMALYKPLGFDFYMGLGPTYSIFDLNNKDYPKADYDFSNAFLQQRKEQFWGFQIRIGMTMGLRL